MKLNIKQYKYEKVETYSKEIEIPTEPVYFFETGVRRSIRIVPTFTTWNKTQLGKEEEVYKLEVTCVYRSFECRIEKFSLSIDDIEEIYYSEKSLHKDFVQAFVNNWLDKRTKEQFESDLNSVISSI